MNGNMEGKHTTADTVKDNLWGNMDGLALDEFAKKLIEIAEEYKSLPGVDLVMTHKLWKVEENPVEDEIPNALINNYNEFIDAWHSLLDLTSVDKVKEWKLKMNMFRNPKNLDEKDAAAFYLHFESNKLWNTLCQFRDLMPLVNLNSTLQKVGNEPAAKKFLKNKEKPAGIDNKTKAFWALFDFAAISQVATDIKNNHIKDSLLG